MLSDLHRYVISCLVNDSLKKSLEQTDKWYEEYYTNYCERTKKQGGTNGKTV